MELKPCPFCGHSGLTYEGVPDERVYRLDIYPPAYAWAVFCDDCDCGGPLKPTEDEAGIAWNTRTSGRARRIRG